MAEASDTPRGPDLSSGTRLEALDEGQPFAGHLDGEAVVLVRRGDEVLAIGAHCTHYGAHLADGLVVGDTVRCPWHHACFSLRTGEALGAPALNPVARWTTEVREGLVFLREKQESAPLSPRGRSAEGPESVMIVGAGAAGSAAAEMLRRLGYAGPVTLVDPDPSAPYDRPNLSKDYLAGNAPEEWIPLRPAGFHAEHGIERVSEAVRSLDPRGRSVTLTSGRTLPYGALLLATGATALRLPIPGGDLPHVHTLRSLADCRAIIAAAEAEEGGRAVVLGASFIGMEVTDALRARGLEVTVAAPESVPFERTLGPELGAALRRLHEENGVRFHGGSKAAAVEAGLVRLDDGTEVAAELVVMGVGVRPDVRLAEEAGLDVDDGVLVDARLRTSAPQVFAAGDAARWPDPRTGERVRVEHWVVAQRMGQAAARNILGADEPFTDVPFFWTAQRGLSLRYVGHAPAWERVEVDGDLGRPEPEGTVRYFSGDRLLAVATVSRDREALEAEVALEGVGG